MDKPECMRCFRVEPLCRLKVASRRARADRLHHIGADHRRDQAQPRLRQAETRRLGSQRDVTCRHQADPATERNALHPGNGRPGQFIEDAHHAGKLARVGQVLGVGIVRHALHPAQIRPGGEALPLTFQHHDTHGLIPACGHECRRQVRDQPVIERVVFFRSGHGDPADPAGHCQSDGVFAHGYILNTPKRVSFMGAFNAADRPSPSTRRVSAGSMMPSSHSRALA